MCVRAVGLAAMCAHNAIIMCSYGHTIWSHLDPQMQIENIMGSLL